MALDAGRRIGPYEIVAPAGAGGMGEVYKARDTRLERTVAIKVLPAELAGDPERRRRLEQEARAVASLAHPHICTLYDIGREDGIDFLVLEYLEGETLAERLRRGALPLDESLRYARQMADALHQAHLRGVVHRDLKPGNVMLTKGGVKLLDFGLAKLKSPHTDPASSALSMSPTRNQPLTREGAIVGTLHYMAPEQLEGKESDERADIFALGAVLYEMVTGRRAFEGESPASIITSIMSKTPTPMAELTPLTPPALDRLVSECLAKDPDARWQNASDLGKGLAWILEPTKETARPRGRLVPAILGALLLLAAGASVLLLSRSEPERTVVRFPVFPPEGTSFHPRAMKMSVSPDGKHLAFVVESGGASLLLVRSLEERDGHVLAQVDSSWMGVPFWSPDSRELAAVSGSKLMRFGVEGGTSRAIGDLGEASRVQGAWNADGVILLGTFFSGIERLSVSGGTLSSVTKLEAGQGFHFAPTFLPDGERFLYSAGGSAEETRGIYLASISGRTKRLLTVASKAAYVEPGYVLYVREGTLLAERFDIDEEKLLGDPIAMAEEVAPFGFSVGGDLLAYRKEVGLNQLTWLDRDGHTLGAAAEPAPYETVTLSRDGKRAAVDGSGPGSDLWLIDLERGGLASRLTSTSFNEGDRIFSPGVREIAFGSNARGRSDVYRLSLAGGHEPILLLDAEEPVFPEDWSSDGKSIVFLRDAQGRKGVWALPLEGDGEPVRLVQGGSFAMDEPRLSPDGRWLAYNADETGRFEVYLHSLDGAERVRVSKDGGGQPRWRDDGHELFFLGLDGTLMSVDFDAQRGRAEIAKPLFQTGLSVDPTIDQYGVAPGGERFLFLLPAGSDEPITVVLNWKTLLGPR